MTENVECGADQFCNRQLVLQQSEQWYDGLCVAQFCSYTNFTRAGSATDANVQIPAGTDVGDGGAHVMEGLPPTSATPSCCRHSRELSSTLTRNILYASNPGYLEPSERVVFAQQYDDGYLEVAGGPSANYTECPCFCKWVNDHLSQGTSSRRRPSADRRRNWWSTSIRPNQVAVDAQASCGLDNYPADNNYLTWARLGLSVPTTTTPSAGSGSGCDSSSHDSCCWSRAHRRRRNDCSTTILRSASSSSSATTLSSTMTFDLPAAAVTAVLNNATGRAASDAALTGAGVAIPASVPASSASTPSSASAPAEGVATSAGSPLHVAPAGTLAT